MKTQNKSKKQKIKKYHSVGTIRKPNIKLVEKGKIVVPEFDEAS